MRILIAGGSGFLGGRLTAALSAAGCDVNILSRRADPGSSGRPGRAGPLLLFSQGAMPDRASRAGFPFRYATLDRALSHLLT